ncbi:MAG TPA: HWE histidine kinase domain-containing protein [Azospirillum sp.]|nr:HWE histidine kinase domain-containing protein [Azospirillum sp.]
MSAPPSDVAGDLANSLIIAPQPAVPAAAVMDLLPDPAVLVERDGAILHANRAFADALGMAPVALAGRRLAELASGDVEPLAIYLRRCAGTFQPLPGALALKAADGAAVPLRCDGAATRLDGGRAGPLMLRCRPPQKASPEFGLLTDKVRQLSQEVLLRRQVEADLRRSEERLRLAVEATGLGTWDFDPVSGRLEWSDRCKALFGLPPDAAVRLPVFYDAVHPDDRASVEEGVRRALDPAGSGVFDMEYRVVGLGDGAERWVAATGRAVFAQGRAVRFIGTALDVTARRQAAALQRLLLNELDHRVKNTLSTVQSIARQTLRHAASVEESRDAFDARLSALSKTHNLLTRTRWRGSDLRELLEAELAPYGIGEDARIRLSGPPVQLDAKTTVALGLAVHELATNAAKYGALSPPGGRVAVVWSVGAGDGGPTLAVDWTESGGPPVPPPRRRGFGSRLIERGLAYDLHGTVRLTFDPGGVRCRMDLPLATAERIAHG